MLEYVAGGIAAFAAIMAARTALVANSSKIRGRQGERKVRNILKKFHKTGGRSFNDLLLPNERGTGQLDHVLVTNHGIFVIETKNYSGKVIGKADESRWTHVLPGRKQHGEPMLNPLMQNSTHISTLRGVLKGVGYVPIYNIVVFADQCEIQNPIKDVVNMSYLKGAIQARCKGDPVLSDDTVRKIGDLLIEKNITDKEVRCQHDAKASLSAEAFKNPDSEGVRKMIEEGKNAPILHFDRPQPAPRGTEMQNLLTEAGASININGKVDSIENFFDGAKRDSDGNKVARKGRFDQFVCPYTGATFPESQAKFFYQGLWLTFFKQHKNAEKYLLQHGPKCAGGTFNTSRVFEAYVKDPEGFKKQTRNSEWYQNVVRFYRSKKTEKAPNLDQQIQEAETKKAGERPELTSPKPEPIR